MKVKIKLIVAFLIANASVFGQDQVKDLVKGGKDDINYLLTGYASPALRSFGYGLNQGWYNTAKPHKLLGFDVTVAPSLVAVPTTEMTFKVDNTKLTTLALVNSTTFQVPTALGAEKPLPQYQIKSIGASSQFNGPGGYDISKSVLSGYVPVPMAQVGIGLIKGFEVKIRYMPTIDLSTIGGVNAKGKINMLGIGILHDIKQYFPVISQLPFDLSVFAGYTKFSLEVGLDGSKPNNKALYESTATTLQVLVSKKLAILTVYGGAGYNLATTKLDVTGSYDVGLGTPLVNPASISVQSNGPRVTAGVRLKLLIFTIHGDYTLQEYSAITGGVGISIRSLLSFI